MKSNKGLRGGTRGFGSDDLLRKATRLEPIRKSGKEKQSFISRLDEEDEDPEWMALRKRESALDYFDDGEEGDGEEYEGEDEEWEDEAEEEDEEALEN